ncbi:hypothetical protein HY384_04480 [Candidatus Daviesbacteria bacterium]|nr:hypothetical protein [Candidatus Daviesbacteria bacterium]
MQIEKMDYVTTNIRITEEDYLRLKAEAAKKRKSFSAVVREKLGARNKSRSRAEVKKLIADLDRTAKYLGNKLRGFDSVKAFREMRYED